MAHRDKTRKTIQKAQRVAVYKRDGYICGYCGEKKKHTSLTVDHIIPVKYGGYHGFENWVSACRSCNRKKWLYGPNEKTAPRLRYFAKRLVAKCSWMAKGGRFPRRMPKISFQK